MRDQASLNIPLVRLRRDDECRFALKVELVLGAAIRGVSVSVLTQGEAFLC
jgi:hypothetical protein